MADWPHAGVGDHRPALLTLVDRIVVMENGKVVADGPRDTLLKQAARNSNVASIA